MENEDFESDEYDGEEIPILEFNWPIFEEEIKRSLKAKINASYVNVIDRTPPDGMYLIHLSC